MEVKAERKINKKNACWLYSALAMILKVIFSIFFEEMSVNRNLYSYENSNETLEDPTNDKPLRRAVEWKDVDTRKTRAGFTQL